MNGKKHILKSILFNFLREIAISSKPFNRQFFLKLSISKLTNLFPNFISCLERSISIFSFLLEYSESSWIIFSSKIIPGNEKKLYKLHNQLVKEGIEVISEENGFVHVSGHPNREDLKDMYNWVKPKCVIPVHGEHRHMIEHINFAKEMQVPHPVQVENGDIVKLYPGDKPEVYDKAPSGKLYLDGNISVEEDSQSIKERKNLKIKKHNIKTNPKIMTSIFSKSVFKSGWI